MPKKEKINKQQQEAAGKEEPDLLSLVGQLGHDVMGGKFEAFNLRFNQRRIELEIIRRGCSEEPSLWINNFGWCLTNGGVTRVPVKD